METNQGGTPPEKPADANALGGCLVMIVAPLLLFVACTAIFSAMGDDGPSSSENRYYAEQACKRSVERQLKAPSTADFSISSVDEKSSNEWSVSGTVDAENSFGAKIRNSWTCIATKSGDSWRGSAILF